MSWLEYHRQSEQLASDAEVAAYWGDSARARELYKEAAQTEEKALQEVESAKSRTYGITAVSAVSLYFKAAEWQVARSLANRCLGSERLPGFAYHQMDHLLDSIKAEQIGVNFDSSHILISITGGEIVPGGAPLDLIVSKSQSIKSLLYRTVEYLKGIHHRLRGEPSKDIRDSYKPWLFQAKPNSYQFSASVQAIRQLNMFDANDMLPKQIIDKSFSILQACAESPRDRLLEAVQDVNYRNTFLKITRDLAPTEKENRFRRLDIRSVDAGHPVILVPATREAINDVIKESRPSLPDGEETEIRGVLRALHLDEDRIEVIDGPNNWRIEGAKEEVDDRIGPMVNRSVVVQTVRTGNRMHFIDIEADE